MHACMLQVKPSKQPHKPYLTRTGRFPPVDSINGTSTEHTNGLLDARLVRSFGSFVRGRGRGCDPTTIVSEVRKPQYARRCLPSMLCQTVRWFTDGLRPFKCAVVPQCIMPAINNIHKIQNSPSTLPSASTQIVCRAGSAHANRWNRCDLFSMASCPHFRPAARNQASARHAHQANAAMQQKYSAINSTVHDVDWR